MNRIHSIGPDSNGTLLRPVEESDASLILQLRLDPRLGRHLSQTESDLTKQQAWIREYLKREEQRREFYFIIETNGVSVGTLRVYDLRKNTFCWGSWIITSGTPARVAIGSVLLVYSFGFNELGYSASHFEVRKANGSVVRFHKRMGAKVVAEDDEYLYFEITKEAVQSAVEMLQRFS